ncbi:hypothetical protein HMPREF1199_00491 [Hoylesella oralis CC98A]|nr:hypothetical protein HMPREF1199_00491 [Hoylesella oralis CC98A]
MEKRTLGADWKSHSTLTLLGKQDLPTLASIRLPLLAQIILTT